MIDLAQVPVGLLGLDDQPHQPGLDVGFYAGDDGGVIPLVAALPPVDGAVLDVQLPGDLGGRVPLPIQIAGQKAVRIVAHDRSLATADDAPPGKAVGKAAFQRLAV